MSNERVAHQFAALNAGSIDHGRDRVDCSPSPGAIWQDLVLAAQDMPPHQWALCCWLWAGWEHCRHDVEAYIARTIRGFIPRESGYSRPARIARITALMLDELRGVHCSHCAGRGIIIGEHGIADCPHCMGHGIASLSGRERARRLGISQSTYRESWREICDAAFGRLRQERDLAVAHIQQRMRRH